MGNNENIGINKENTKMTVKAYIQCETEIGCLLIFTDGSYPQEKGGCATIGHAEVPIRITFGQPKGFYKYGMEEMVLSICLNY